MYRDHHAHALNDKQSMNHISLKKYRPKCYVKSPTAQDAFRPILGLISCARVTGRQVFIGRAFKLANCACASGWSSVELRWLCQVQGVYAQAELSYLFAWGISTRGYFPRAVDRRYPAEWP